MATYTDAEDRATSLLRGRRDIRAYRRLATLCKLTSAGAEHRLFEV